MTIPFDFSVFLTEQLLACALQTDGFGGGFDPVVRPCEPRFGDFQANGVLAWAKRNNANPRALATALTATLQESEAFAQSGISVEIAGPGFLNFTLPPGLLLEWLKSYDSEPALLHGAGSRMAGKNAVIDFPSPNTAKQMHIGHLRPMVIGEAIKRMLAFCGAKVTQDDHLGDWGTNFGTLIMRLKQVGGLTEVCSESAVATLEKLYKEGTELEKEQPELRDQSRAELLKLQQGDPENTALWKQIVEASKSSFGEIYCLLGVQPDIARGESYYRDKVERIYSELTQCQLAEESDGALVVFHREHKRFAKQPFIIRKKDGASNYASTDLATVLDRIEDETIDADMIVYVTDGRQQDHFQQLFLTTQKWFAAKAYKLPELRHVWFGTILGEDGKAIKTRSGEPIYLRALLNEAQERALAIVKEKNPELPEAEQQAVARAVGIGAVRYADLSQNRTQDYAFSWPKLLSFDGNTAPYLLYAVARIHSIFRKADLDVKSPGAVSALCNNASDPQTENELALARKLVAFPVAIDLALADLRPHLLCTYLYELAGIYSSFYNADHVMVDEPTIRARRLLLCARTLLILETGLHLLGLETVERM